MRYTARLLFVCLTTSILAAPLVGAPTAMAQCSITGPAQVCPGDSIQLCGPAVDNVSYLWQGPDGTLYMTACIDVFDPGLYTLSVRDLVTRVWSEPCSLTVRSGRAAAPAITGPASTCSGSSVEWCGPAGNFEYAWSGPNGFAASTACVTIGAAGNYALRVRELPSGCWGDSTPRPLAVTTCGSGAVNCPRPAWWWSTQCSSMSPSPRRLQRSQIGSVAGCVDDHASSLAWVDDATGFTRMMKRGQLTLQARARRQFAAVWANVCAGQLGVTTQSGPSVSLDPATRIDANLGGGTVASWLARADDQLAQLSHMSDRSRAVKESYRRLIATGWSINHGIGIGTTCHADLRDDARTAGADAVAADPAEPEPLADELADVGDGPLTFGVLEPNPFSAQTSLAFSVSATTSAPVSIAVYDVSGRLVRELVRTSFAPGQYVTNWDGRSSDGAPVKSGLYFIRGRIGDQLVQSRVSFIR